MEDSVFIAEGMNALQTAVFLNVTDLAVAASWCGEPLVPVSVRIWLSWMEHSRPVDTLTKFLPLSLFLFFDVRLGISSWRSSKITRERTRLGLRKTSWGPKGWMLWTGQRFHQTWTALNTWDELGRRLRKRLNQPNNIAELRRALQEEWRNIPMATVRRLVRSVRRRLQTVIQNNGGHCRYWKVWHFMSIPLFHHVTLPSQSAPCFFIIFVVRHCPDANHCFRKYSMKYIPRLRWRLFW